MPRMPGLFLALLNTTLTLAVLAAADVPAAAAMPGPAPQVRISQVLDEVPLTFEANQGQVDRAVQFFWHGGASALFLTADEAVLSLGAARQASAVVRMRLAGGKGKARLVGEERQATRSNYLRGGDSREWQTGVAHYASVRAQGVLPGVDVVYRGNRRRLEYDLVIAPGSDPGRIRLVFAGADAMAIGAQGELILHTAAGDLVQPAPAVFQQTGAGRRQVEGRYVLLTSPAREKGGAGVSRQVGFLVGRYDRTRPLIIDPVLDYSTFLGASGLIGDVAVDADGNVYVTGSTTAPTFPGVNGASLQPANAGAYDAFVSKIDPSGAAIVFSTFLGGSGNDNGYALAIDGSGSIYLAGSTDSTIFPGVGAGSIQAANAGAIDAFVTKLDPTGAHIVYSTFLGGSGEDIVRDVAVDGAGNAYVTGVTLSATFPGVNVSSIQAVPGGNFDAFVTKIDAAGAAIVYSTFLGGSGDDEGNRIAVDGAGNAYVSGSTRSATFPGVNCASIQPVSGGLSDAFVTKLDPAGSAIVYSTFLGGSGEDAAFGIAVDGAGRAYVTGYSGSINFPGVGPSSIQPTQAGGIDAFVTQISADGTAILYSTFLGGGGDDSGYRITVDGVGNAYVSGETASTTFPGVTASSIQPTPGGSSDAFVAELDPAGTAALYATFLGGSGFDVAEGVAIDHAGDVYVAGYTTSSAFPGVSGSSIQPTKGGFGCGFLTKISLGSGFFTLPPCRVVDTRGAVGPLGAPALQSGAQRSFDVAGACGIPPTARSLSVNLTVVQAAAAGDLRLFPAGTPAPLASAISFQAGGARANNALVTLSGGSFTVQLASAGDAHLVVDVNGYFQ